MNVNVSVWILDTADNKHVRFWMMSISYFPFVVRGRIPFVDSFQLTRGAKPIMCGKEMLPDMADANGSKTTGNHIFQDC